MCEVLKRCGTCRLYGPNFYRGLPGGLPDATCCANAVMDLPASFIPNRQTMAWDDGANCIVWEPAALQHKGAPNG